MQPDSFEDAVRRLDRCNYDVHVEADGYLIQHRDDPTDVSRAPTLELLIDLADLMEWAAQRKHKQRHAFTDTTARSKNMA